MDNKQFNKKRYNRNKQYYRASLGIQQLINRPLLNLIWIPFGISVMFEVIIGKKYIANMVVYPLLQPIFSACIKTIMFIFPIICAIGITQLIGYCTAIKDEASLENIFSERDVIKEQPPLLIYKKKDKKTGVVAREFYTTIPMARWKEQKEEICDRFNIRLVSEIEYGGRKKNKGNRIYFESIKGRKPTERGILYDDSF